MAGENSNPLAGRVVKDYRAVFHCKLADSAKEIGWTKFPVDRSGDSYRRLMHSPQGHTAFCVFIGIIRLCARGRTGGALTVKGRDMTPQDVQRETGIHAARVQAGIATLIDKEVGWLPTKEEEAKRNRTPVESQSTASRAHLASRASDSFSASGSGCSSGEGGAGETEPEFREPPPRTVLAGPSGRVSAYLLAQITREYPVQTRSRASSGAAERAVIRLVSEGKQADDVEAVRWLSDRVRAFCAAVKGADPRFLPHAPRWFEEGMYDDDDAAWKLLGRDNAKAGGPVTEFA